MPSADRIPVYVELADGSTTWRLDKTFLASSWTCIWGRGCCGIEDDAAPDLHRGCCSVGAQMADEAEGQHLSAVAAMLNPDRFQFHEVAEASGIFRDEARSATAIVDGACIFLNRPGFEGGKGCALHLGAIDDGESPIGYKPLVCWQVPLLIEDTGTVVTVRPSTRADWGPGGETMAWWCADADNTDAHVGDVPAVEGLSEELRHLMGDELYDRARAAVLNDPS
jgi:hypothetical protein